MIGWDALKIARKDETKKISSKFRVSFGRDEALIFKFVNGELTEDEESFNFKEPVDPTVFNCADWRVLESEPKIIKWYHPKIMWHKDENKPSIYRSFRFFNSEKEAVEYYSDFKIIEWKIIEAPENWEGCQ